MTQSGSITGLQELFVKAKSGTIVVGEFTIHQMDFLPAFNGRVKIDVLTPPDKETIQVTNGVRVHVRKGTLKLPDGSRTKTFVQLNRESCYQNYEFSVSSKNDTIVICNAFETKHRKDFVTIDHIIGDAGMLIEGLGDHKRRYSCSNWKPPFDPSNFVFELTLVADE